MNFRFLQKTYAETASERVFAFWFRHATIFAFTLLVGVCVWGGLVWYYSLYAFHWSDEERQAYVEKQSVRTELDASGLSRVLRVLEHRKEAFQASDYATKNIFMTDPPKEPTTKAFPSGIRRVP